MQPTNAKKIIIQQQIKHNLSRPTSTGSKKASNGTSASRAKVSQNEGTTFLVA
jgi:hypothetical protein